MEFCRGDIWFVKKINPTIGSEQDAGRPAIIVSNNIGNEHSSIVEIVWLTTQDKKPLPTHVDIMCRVPSIALCEQITTVSQDRLGDFVRTCTDDEMAEIDRALMVALGLTLPMKTDVTAVDRINRQKIDDLTAELECTERKLDEFNAENADLKEKLKNAEKQIPVFPVEIEKELLRAETQRDMYKELYEQAIDKLIG